MLIFESNKQHVQRLYDDHVEPDRFATLRDVVSDELVNTDGPRRMQP